MDVFDRMNDLETRFLVLDAAADWLLSRATTAASSAALHVRAVLETCRRELREVKELAAE